MSRTLTGSVIVERSAEPLYKMRSHMQDFPKLMRHIKTAVPMGRLISHWVMEGPTGRSIERDARITEIESNRGHLRMIGEIDRRPLGKNRKEVAVSIQYNLNEGTIDKVGGMLADPQGDLEAGLHRYKAYAEGVPVHLM